MECFAPLHIYHNKNEKRGSFSFVKTVMSNKYFYSIEIDKDGVPHIVTIFRIQDSYLKNYELLWEWKGGSLHRNAFNTGGNQSTSTPQ